MPETPTLGTGCSVRVTNSKSHRHSETPSQNNKISPTPHREKIKCYENATGSGRAHEHRSSTPEVTRWNSAHLVPGQTGTFWLHGKGQKEDIMELLILKIVRSG